MKFKTNIFILLILSNLLTATTIKDAVQTTDNNFCKVNKGVKVCMKVKASYSVVSSDNNNTVVKRINRIIKQVMEKIKKNIKENFRKIDEKSFSIHLLSTTQKSFSLKVSHFYKSKNLRRGNSEFLNYDILTGKKIELDELFIKGYREKLEAYAENAYRIQNHLTPKENSELVAFEKNKFFLPRTIGIGNSGLQLIYDSKKIKPSTHTSHFVILDYRFLQDIINPKSYLSVFLKEKKLGLNVPKYYTFIDKFGIIQLTIQRDSKTRMEIFGHLQNRQPIEGGGLLSISFPNLLIDRDNISSIHGDFKIANHHLYSVHNFEKESNIIKSHSLLEAEIKRWKRYGESKNISFSFDIPSEMKRVELDIYATFISEKTNQIFRIPFSREKKKLKSHKITIDLK